VNIPGSGPHMERKKQPPPEKRRLYLWKHSSQAGQEMPQLSTP